LTVEGRIDENGNLMNGAQIKLQVHSSTYPRKSNNVTLELPFIPLDMIEAVHRLIK
jgi:hypothetical protein